MQDGLAMDKDCWAKWTKPPSLGLRRDPDVTPPINPVTLLTAVDLSLFMHRFPARFLKMLQKSLQA